MSSHLASLTTPEVKTNLGELKSSLSEMKNLGSAGSGVSQLQHLTTQTQSSITESRNYNRSVSTTSGAGQGGGASLKQITGSFKRNDTSPAILEIERIPSSAEPVDIDEASSAVPIVTSPISEMTEMDMNFGSDSETNSSLTSPNLVSSMGGLTLSNASPLAKINNMSAGHVGLSSSAGVGGGVSANSFSHEERKSSSTSKTKIVTDKYSTESVTANAAQLKRVQAGDVSFEEKTASAASKARLEKDGIVAEKESSLKHASRLQKISDGTVREESATAAMSGNKLHSGSFSAENVSASSAVSRSTLDSATGKFTSESHAASATSKKMSITGQDGVTKTSQLLSSNQISKMINTKMSHEELNKYLTSFDDLDKLGNTTNVKEVENALVKYCGVMSNTVEQLKKEKSEESVAGWITKVNNMMSRAWTVPKFGQDIGETLCDIMRNNGGLDLVMENCVAKHSGLQFNSAKLLEQCLVTENRGYVVEKGLEKVIC